MAYFLPVQIVIENNSTGETHVWDVLVLNEETWKYRRRLVEKNKDNWRSTQDMRYRVHFTLHGPFLFKYLPVFGCVVLRLCLLWDDQVSLNDWMFHTYMFHITFTL